MRRFSKAADSGREHDQAALAIGQEAQPAAVAASYRKEAALSNHGRGLESAPLTAVPVFRKRN